ncbi:MAG: glycerol-3-phosphate 1-O-acyltransferase PlsY [Verrucomicrobiota bacterium]|nr:glycerol-3-phosphate 1-O-acyltransferase PlsY [Verrucomicrobiota bacterium]
MWKLSTAVILLSYVIGSFPTGYIVGKIAGMDVREQGSGNIGATNVLRLLGKGWGYSVFFTDAFKGFLAVRLALMLVARAPGTIQYADFFAILAAAACVVGHSFPLWLWFRGGKGVATSAGSILGVMPLAAITIFLVWVVVFLITRYASLASIIAALALPPAVAVLMHLQRTQGVVLLYFSAAMTALVVWRHRSNIARLLNGTEQRFTRR